MTAKHDDGIRPPRTERATASEGKGGTSMPVQVFDIHTTAAGDDAIDFTAGAGSSWTIAPGTVVAADLGAGVSSLIHSSSLINHGTILTTGTYAAVSFMETGQIINAADGSITGATGIATDHANIDVVNFGSVFAEAIGVRFNGDTDDTSLDNRGLIFSNSTGVSDQSAAHGARDRQ